MRFMPESLRHIYAHTHAYVHARKHARAHTHLLSLRARSHRCIEHESAFFSTNTNKSCRMYQRVMPQTSKDTHRTSRLFRHIQWLWIYVRDMSSLMCVKWPDKWWRITLWSESSTPASRGVHINELRRTYRISRLFRHIQWHWVHVCD